MIPNYNPPSAWYGHENFLNWLIITKQPDIFVEVGVHYGFSYFIACQTVKARELKTVCIGVDTWEGDQHTIYDNPGDAIFSTVNAHNSSNYSNFSFLVRKPSTEAAGLQKDRSVDILHIDAGHTYEAVKSDFITWLPKMKKGGVILLHDTVVTGPGLGVNQFYNEIHSLFPSFNFEHSYGLGVLTIDRYPPE